MEQLDYSFCSNVVSKHVMDHSILQAVCLLNKKYDNSISEIWGKKKDISSHSVRIVNWIVQ